MPASLAMAGRAPRSLANSNAGTHGNLPAIATHGGIEPALCTWRWQAGGGQVGLFFFYIIPIFQYSIIPVLGLQPS